MQWKLVRDQMTGATGSAQRTAYRSRLSRGGSRSRTRRRPRASSRKYFDDPVDNDGDDLEESRCSFFLIPDPCHPKGQRRLREAHAAKIAATVAREVFRFDETTGKWLLTMILQNYFNQITVQRGWILGMPAWEI